MPRVRAALRSRLIVVMVVCSTCMLGRGLGIWLICRCFSSSIAATFDLFFYVFLLLLFELFVCAYQRTKQKKKNREQRNECCTWLMKKRVKIYQLKKKRDRFFITNFKSVHFSKLTTNIFCIDVFVCIKDKRC